jgi:metacaspase-1
VVSGISLHIGLNSVDPAHYDGWDGSLVACEFDAHDMEAIALDKGFRATMKLLTADATSTAIIGAIEQAAQEVKAGDLFLLTYSGHGGQVTDTNGDEDDQSDETWLAYDRQILDDELYALYAKFDPGVRILVLSDSCHSGSVVKAVGDEQAGFVPDALKTREKAAAQSPKYRAMPLDVMGKTYHDHKKLYDGLQEHLPDSEHTDPAATVLLISGCKDEQTSLDGMSNGLFTETLRQTWNDGAWNGGGHKAFCDAIVAQMPPDQTPQYLRVGAANDAFEQQPPFTV